MNSLNINKQTMETYSFVADGEDLENSAVNISLPKKRERVQIEERGRLPLMTKRMNKVEKYIREFSEQTIERNKEKRQRYELSVTTLKAEEPLIRPIDPSRSIFVSELDLHQSSYLQGKSQDKYISVQHQDSLGKYETLNKMEDDYVDLKKRITATKIVLPRLASIKREGRFTVVSAEEIGRKLKTTMVKEEGKEYFGDLYLLKKGRERIFSSLSKIGDYQLGSSSLSVYSDIVQEVDSTRKAVKQTVELTRNQIILDRKDKKSKMMSNRYMHGNAYYDMMSLSKRQRNNLRKVSRFPATYGLE